MSNFFKSLATALILFAGISLEAQTIFPQPGQNIYLDGSHILVGSIPARVVGTNTPSPAMVLNTDGINMYWDSAGSLTPGGTVNNYTINNISFDIVTNFENITINTNVVFNQQITVQSNATFNSSVLVQTNVTVNQNISVSGKATLQQIIITNSVKFATNTFPLTAGTVWDLSRYHQLIVTNADFNITALGGLSNNLVNLGELVVSNSAAGNIICHLQFAGNKIGPNTTNDVYIGSAKEAYISVETIATQRTNYVTAVEQ